MVQMRLWLLQLSVVATGCNVILPLSTGGPLADSTPGDAGRSDAALTDGPRLDGAGPAAAFCSAGGWCWENPRPQGNTLRAVWGAAPDAVFAVGDGGTILRHDGKAWSPMSSPTTRALYAVWGASETEVFAVGETGTILRYDGKAWSLMSSPVSSSLNGVAGRSSSEVYAVGYSGVILRYDGSKWGVMQGAGITLNTLWSDGQSLYAVGTEESVLRLEGAAWKVLHNDPAGQSLRGVWSKGSDVYAVGGLGRVLHSGDGGEGWTAIDVGTGSTLNTIWGVSAGALYVGDSSGRIHYFDGTAWSKPTTPSVSTLYGVWGSGPDDIHAVGAHGALIHNDGLAWYRAGDAVSTESLAAAWSGPYTLAVGDDCTILGHDDAGWSPLPCIGGAYDHLFGVWGAGSAVLVVGAGGQVLRHQGSAWDLGWGPITSGTSEDLNAVWGPAANEMYIVGAKGTILRFDGAALTPMSSGTTAALYAVWGTGAADVYAAGEGGALLRYDGVKWVSLPTASAQTIRGLNGVEGDLYAVGAQGTILHSAGKETPWSSMASGTSEHLLAVWRVGPKDVYVVGNKGVILHYNGTTWHRMSSGAANLRGIWGSGPSDIRVFGDGGTILRYRP